MALSVHRKWRNWIVVVDLPWKGGRKVIGWQHGTQSQQRELEAMCIGPISAAKKWGATRSLAIPMQFPFSWNILASTLVYSQHLVIEYASANWAP